ncbi:MAG: hypothetical protein HUU45_03915 [Leptospiraceae bacterium]|nr:hypothetical protein [Leptospiraceae bacterium]
MKTIKIKEDKIKPKLSFLKESYSDKVWYRNLSKRPGIEKRFPYFKNTKPTEKV